jgi:hypothetical protein
MPAGMHSGLLSDGQYDTGPNLLKTLVPLEEVAWVATLLVVWLGPHGHRIQAVSNHCWPYAGAWLSSPHHYRCQ